MPGFLTKNFESQKGWGWGWGWHVFWYLEEFENNWEPYVIFLFFFGGGVNIGQWSLDRYSCQKKYVFMELWQVPVIEFFST